MIAGLKTSYLSRDALVSSKEYNEEAATKTDMEFIHVFLIQTKVSNVMFEITNAIASVINFIEYTGKYHYPAFSFSQDDMYSDLLKMLKLKTKDYIV